MERPQLVTSALPVFAIVLITCALYSEGACDQCTIYPHADSPNFDLNSYSPKTPAECADTCFDLKQPNKTVVAFVIGEGDLCWCKYQLRARFTARAGRTIVTMGNKKSCQHLFE